MFPFGDINRDLHRQLADKIYNVELAKDDDDAGDVKKERSITEESVFVGLSYLVEEKGVDCKIFNFADVFARGGEGILSASSFDFRSYMSIEVNHVGATKATNLMSRVAALQGKTTVKEGSMQDYFPHYAEVVYCNVTDLRDTMCDEGLLIRLVLQLSSGMLPGCYLMVVSSFPNMCAEDFGYQHRKIGTLTIRLHALDKCVMTLFQTAPPPYIPKSITDINVLEQSDSDFDDDGDNVYFPDDIPPNAQLAAAADEKVSSRMLSLSSKIAAKQTSNRLDSATSTKLPPSGKLDGRRNEEEKIPVADAKSRKLSVRK